MLKRERRESRLLWRLFILERVPRITWLDCLIDTGACLALCFCFVSFLKVPRVLLLFAPGKLEAFPWGGRFIRPSLVFSRLGYGERSRCHSASKTNGEDDDLKIWNVRHQS